jgi:hypothetical protein
VSDVRIVYITYDIKAAQFFYLRAICLNAAAAAADGFCRSCVFCSLSNIKEKSPAPNQLEALV